MADGAPAAMTPSPRGISGGLPGGRGPFGPANVTVPSVRAVKWQALQAGEDNFTPSAVTNQRGPKAVPSGSVKTPSNVLGSRACAMRAGSSDRLQKLSISRNALSPAATQSSVLRI